MPLGRVANELDVRHSFEYDMVELADDIAAPGSMMPQKKNPSVVEVKRMIGEGRKTLAESDVRHEQRLAALDAAQAEFDKAVAELMGS